MYCAHKSADGKHSAILDFTELKTKQRLAIRDIVLDGVAVAGCAFIDLRHPGGKRVEPPAAIGENNASFWELMNSVGESLDIYTQGYQKASQPLGLDDIIQRIDEETDRKGAWKNGGFTPNERIHTTTGYGTVWLAKDALTHFKDAVLHRMVATGKVRYKDAVRAVLRTKTILKLLDKHESKIEHVKIGPRGFGVEELANVEWQIETCELAERHDIRLNMARMVFDYINDREHVEGNLRELVKEGSVSKRSAKSALTEIKTIAGREAPGFVRRTIRQIGNTLSI